MSNAITIAKSLHDRVLEQARKSLRKRRRVVPLKPRSRVPRDAAWPKLNITEDEFEQYFQPDDNIGWILGEPSGDLVDIDLDCPPAVELAPDFLPSTERSHGRGNQEPSHYFYTVTPAPATKQFTDIDGKKLVEFRSTGCQTMIPPSIHPSGQRLRWTKAGAPTRVSGSDLLDRVGKLAAASLLTLHWPAEGNRHNAALALAGTLLRGGWSKDEAAEFVGRVARAAADEEWQARENDVRTTAQKLATSEAATGLPRLQQIFGDEVVSKFCTWLGLKQATESRNGNRRQSPWPEPLASDAYHGLAGQVVRAIEPHSEADPAALLIQTLTLFGNVVGREPHFKVEGDRHGTNIFSVLVGPTSKGRKGSSLSQTKSLFAEVDGSWASGCVQSGLSSGEGLIWAVRDAIERREPVKKKGRVTGYQMVRIDAGVADKRLVDVETEFASVLRILGRDGSTLSATIREAWDSGQLRIMNKNSPAKATGAHISMIGHITRDELRRNLGSTEIGNGFANRFLWICVRRSQVLPFGGKVPEGELTGLVLKAKAAVETARNISEIRFSEKAASHWSDVYPDLSRGRPGLLGAVTSRAEAQVVRLACIYALLDCSTIIKTQHLRAALAVWKYAEDSARYIFGNSLGDPVADQLLNAIRGSQNGLTRTEIRDVFARNRNAREIDQALAALAESGFVRLEREGPVNGRPAERWLALESI